MVSVRFKFLFVLLFFFGQIGESLSQEQIIPLWEGAVPNQRITQEREKVKRADVLLISNVQQPVIEVYLPTKRTATGQAMIVCPGGGYRELAYDWEGLDAAKWLNSLGIAAFVLKYRLPDSKSLITNHTAPLMDAQRAIRIVRHNASRWNIAQDKIGVLGFSAGGHLAATLSTRFDELVYESRDEIDAISARPDWAVLVYPVITMDTAYTHMGSRRSLIGNSPAQHLVEYYSNELHVDEKTPPTFLQHSSDDIWVHVMNSVLFYQALQKNGISSEMHIYATGGHGYAFGIGKQGLEDWNKNLATWLKIMNKF